jgi:hypothetical protein
VHKGFSPSGKLHPSFCFCKLICIFDVFIELSDGCALLMQGTHSTYPQAGILCFGRQKITIFEVQFFAGSSVVKNPACG